MFAVERIAINETRLGFNIRGQSQNDAMSAIGSLTDRLFWASGCVGADSQLSTQLGPPNCREARRFALYSAGPMLCPLSHASKRNWAC